MKTGWQGNPWGFRGFLDPSNDSHSGRSQWPESSEEGDLRCFSGYWGPQAQQRDAPAPVPALDAFAGHTQPPGSGSHPDAGEDKLRHRKNRPIQAHGQTVDRVLGDMMRVSARPMEIRGKLDDLFLKIEQKKLQKANRILHELKGEIGLDPDLVKAETPIRRKELSGR